VTAQSRTGGWRLRRPGTLLVALAGPGLMGWVACASQPVDTVWTKPGGTDQELSETRSICLERQVPRNDEGLATKRSEARLRRVLYNSCMNEHGWRTSNEPIADDPTARSTSVLPAPGSDPETAPEEKAR
jgi:hypothetical protein